MEVTLEAAPTTPEITFRTCVLLQWYSASSMLLMDPETLTLVKTQRKTTKREYRTKTFTGKRNLFQLKETFILQIKRRKRNSLFGKLFKVQFDISVAIKTPLTKRS